jgi:glutamine synthetase
LNSFPSYCKNSLYSPPYSSNKTLVNAANPYLALGGVIAAGLDGVQKQRSLPEPITVDPAILSEDERQSRHIELLPQSLAQATAYFRHDQPLFEALGKDYASTFLAVREAEWKAMQNFTLEEEVKLLLERY